MQLRVNNLAISLGRDQSENDTNRLGAIRTSLDTPNHMLRLKAHVASNDETQREVESLLVGNEMRLMTIEPDCLSARYHVDMGKDLDLQFFSWSNYPMFIRLAPLSAAWSMSTVVNRFVKQLCKCILLV